MKIINQSLEFSRWNAQIPKHKKEAYNQLKGIEKTIVAKYGKSDYSFRLFETGTILNLLGTLKGKTILDIGCGAERSWDYDASQFAMGRRMYDPWLCRSLHELGANVIGIDGGSSNNEEYRHIQQNLMSSGKLIDSFQNKSIDLACAFSLFDSPSMGDGKGMFHFLIDRLEPKIKDEGFFVFEATGTEYCDKNQWQEFLLRREKR